MFNPSNSKNKKFLFTIGRISDRLRLGHYQSLHQSQCSLALIWFLPREPNNRINRIARIRAVRPENVYFESNRTVGKDDYPSGLYFGLA
ncbi:hypothetical protein CJF32_00006577 [Rutstroemia sp. NJR-2017a WRK4]|nr:hypothetical protein CJF32_00006577 [Rutstroemia sp. NJR-2017a WRK4]